MALTTRRRRTCTDITRSTVPPAPTVYCGAAADGGLATRTRGAATASARLKMTTTWPRVGRASSTTGAWVPAAHTATPRAVQHRTSKLGAAVVPAGSWVSCTHRRVDHQLNHDRPVPGLLQRLLECRSIGSLHLGAHKAIRRADDDQHVLGMQQLERRNPRGIVRLRHGLPQERLCRLPAWILCAERS